MRILLTGFGGNVGSNLLGLLVHRGHDVRAVDLQSKHNLRLARKYERTVDFRFGDIRDDRFVTQALSGVDAVVHLAAIIPPKAEQDPELAESVNVGATERMIGIMESLPSPPRLVFTSSIAIYGDRVKTPFITETDPPAPSPRDNYARHKIACEKRIRASTLNWTILRLSYVVSAAKLAMDPLLFEMPLETAIEPVHSVDVAIACANAAERLDLGGETLLIAGGPKNRVMYRDYLDTMMRIFGLGGMFLPDAAFATGDFHCGFMDTARSQKLLRYQHRSMDYYYRQVRMTTRARRPVFTVVRPIARAIVLSRSP